MLAVIQARMEATRLPGKVLLPLGKRTVLEQVIYRTRMSKVHDIIVATTVNAKDDEIENKCNEIGIKVFRGSEDDVLDRYYQAVNRLMSACLQVHTNIVRITADCPLIEPEVINRVIEMHILSKADYTSNIIERTYPDGWDVEVFTLHSLDRAWVEADSEYDREHVTPYMIRNFRTCSVVDTINLSHIRWTLDTPEDYDVIKRIYGQSAKII